MKTAETKTTFSPPIRRAQQSFFSKDRQNAFFPDKAAGAPSQPFFEKKARSLLQAKLNIGQPGDKNEQEADAMADKVVQGLSNPHTAPPNSPLGAVPVSTSFAQTKCAACEKEEEPQKKEGDEEDFRQDKRLQQKPVLESTAALPDDEKNIRRKCAACEQAENLQRRIGFSSPNTASPSIESHLTATKGTGRPLPSGTRQQMESSFGTGFSGVRIHTGSAAVQMNKDLNAQAFTHGNDIYFGAGKYDAATGSGKHLLAHELTHTIQQGKNIVPAVQKQDEPPGSADQPAEQEPAWDPEEVIVNYLQEWEDEKSAENEEDAWEPVELSDEGPSAWIGSGAQGQRKYLLLYSEWQKVSGNETYKKGITESFLKEPEPGEAYLTSLKASFDQVSKDEQTTLTYLNQQLALGATAENFIDLEPFRGLDAANAFPNFSWQIVIKLIAPPESLDSQVNQDYTMSQKYYESYWAQLANDLYTNGLPVSYLKSLNLDFYRLIRPLLVKHLPSLPDKPYMLDNFIVPGETALHSAILQHCVSSFAYHGVSAVKLQVLDKWKEASAFRWMSFDTRAISDFRKEYPTGFSYLDQFYRFEHKGIAYSLAEIAIAIILQLVGAGGQSPYKVLGFKSAAARDLAPEFLSLFVQQAHRNFDANFQLADGMINPLSPNDKLLKAVNWSLEKGFAGQSITMLLDKLDEILLDIIKEWAKQKGIKKGVTTVLNIVGAFNPLGRLVSFAYTAYDTYDDIEDLTEIIGLVNSLVSIMDEARNSKTVIQTQRSAARLAEATVTIIPVILQILGTKVLDKVSKGMVKDVSGTYSEAKRNKLLDDTSHKNDATKLNPEEVDAEVLTALKSTVYKSKNKNYDAIIILPNGHQWRRNKQGIWCRASDSCLLPSTNSAFINELNSKVNGSIQNADAFDPDNDREFYEFLKKEGHVTESFEDFMKTRPNQPAEGTDLTAEILAGQHQKPTTGNWKQAPRWDKWVNKGGKVIQHGDGSVTYVAKDGQFVKFSPEGYPDFSNHLTHPDVKSVDLPGGFDPKRTPDYKKANELVGKGDEWGSDPPEGYRWHHHQNGRTMQLVPKAIHELFTHAGGISQL